MFMDEVVFAGLAIVGLTCLFFVGFYLAIKKDISKHGTGEQSSVAEVKTGIFEYLALGPVVLTLALFYVQNVFKVDGELGVTVA